MPRYEYRLLNPMSAAEKAMLDWITGLDKESQIGVGPHY